MKLCFFALFAALTFALPPKSLEKQNQELSRTNQVLVQALKELTTSNQGQAEKAVAWWDDYGEPSKDCSSFPKECVGCRRYLDSCCSDKNCNGGRKCKMGLYSYSCDSAAETEEDVGFMGQYKCLKRNDCIADCQAGDESKTWYDCMKECPKELCAKDAESDSADPESEEDSADGEEEAVGLTCSKDGFEGTVTTDSWCDKRDYVWMHKCSDCKHGYYWYWWHTYCCTPGKSGCTCAYN